MVRGHALGETPNGLGDHENGPRGRSCFQRAAHRKSGLALLLALLAGGPLGLPRATEAQAAEKVPRIGFLYFGSRQSAVGTGRYETFMKGLRELGYVPGRSVLVEERFADGTAERLPALVADLVGLRVDAIVATGSPTYSALRQATTTIPIIITVSADPVGEGLATSLARPGRNVTGLSTAGSDVFPKQIELLMACVPELARVTLLWNATNSSHPALRKQLQAVAQTVGIRVAEVEAHTPEDIQRSFPTMARGRTGAVVFLSDTFFVQQRRQVADLALTHRLPSISEVREYAEVGGFMAYGQNVTDNFRHAATYVDKILKGAKPGDLPIGQPTTFELVVNLKTAKALGLTIPQSVLIRADEVIQ